MLQPNLACCSARLLLSFYCAVFRGRFLRPTWEPRLGPTSFLGAALGAASAASARTTSLAARWGLAASNKKREPDQCHAAPSVRHAAWLATERRSML